MKTIISSLLLASVFALTACNSNPKSEDKAAATPVAQTPAALPKSVEEAVADTNYRTPTNRDRDAYRHPIETLNFFGLKPEMTVIELSPGAGWYTEIVAPLVAENGKYIGTSFPRGVNSYADGYMAKLDAYLSAHPELQSKTSFVPFVPGKQMDLGENQADLVLTFRNVHNWMDGGHQQAVFNAAFKALKPGGVFGIVEHRANAKGKKDAKGSSGYVLEKDVIAWAKKAGFKLEAKSEINANPKDTKNYEKGVWTLPPSLALGDKDREKYVAIGESDRMTLKFVKPAKKN